MSGGDGERVVSAHLDDDLKPARSRVYELRFAGAGQFGAAVSGRVAITVK